jgi:hypothetical protein
VLPPRANLIGLVLLAALSGCGSHRNEGEAPPAKAVEGQPPESLLLLETKYHCLRAIGPGGISDIRFDADPPLPGTRLAHTQAEWYKLWDYLNYSPNTRPPMDLPSGTVAVGITIYGSFQSHVHLREVADGGRTVVFGYQTEIRHFPLHRDGTSTIIADGDFMESLVFFYPGDATKQFGFTALPDLVWMAPTDEVAVARPPCAYGASNR